MAQAPDAVMADQHQQALEDQGGDFHQQLELARNVAGHGIHPAQDLALPALGVVQLDVETMVEGTGDFAALGQLGVRAVDARIHHADLIIDIALGRAAADGRSGYAPAGRGW